MQLWILLFAGFLSFGPPSNASTLSLSARQTQALKEARKKNYDEVIQLLNPHSHLIGLKALIALAEAYHAKKDHNDELRVLKIAEKKQPDNPTIQYKLAQCYLKNNDQEQAIKSFRRAIDIHPKFVEAFEGLLSVFVENKNNYESRVLLKDMIRRFGNKPKYFSELCRLNSVDGYLDEAISSCKEAIHKDPKHPDNHVYLAMAYKDKGETNLAGSILAKAADHFKASEFVQFTAGTFFSAENNWPVAVRYFKQAVTADGKTARSQIGLAEALFQSEKYEEALEHYILACQLDSSHRSQMLSAGAKLRTMGKEKLSRQYESQNYKCLVN